MNLALQYNIEIYPSGILNVVHVGESNGTSELFFKQIP